MRKILLPLAALPLVLAACAAPAGNGVTTRDALMRNPLYADHAHQNLVMAITDMQIDQDKALSGALVSRAEKTKERELKFSREAKDRTARGLHGTLIPLIHDATGQVLVEEDMLWTSVDFFVTPGFDVHVYLSGAHDPRDIPFPSPSDVDLGTLPSTFGPLGIALPEYNADIRSVVLWDDVAKRVLAFAQVRREKSEDE